MLVKMVESESVFSQTALLVRPISDTSFTWWSTCSVRERETDREKEREREREREKDQQMTDCCKHPKKSALQELFKLTATVRLLHSLIHHTMAGL